jgi:hypothetical protein
LASRKKICGRSKQCKNFALLTQNIGVAVKMFWPSPVKPPVETGFTPSQESRQAAVSTESRRFFTKFYKVKNTILEFDFGWRLSFILGGAAVHRCDKRPVLRT